MRRLKIHFRDERGNLFHRKNTRKKMEMIRIGNRAAIQKTIGPQKPRKQGAADIVRYHREPCPLPKVKMKVAQRKLPTHAERTQRANLLGGGYLIYRGMRGRSSTRTP